MAISIVPQLWSKYATEALTTSLNAYSGDGLEVYPNAIIQQGDNRWRWPMLQPLDSLITMTAITSSSTLTPTAATDYQELYPVKGMEQAISMTGYDQVTSGVALQQYAPQIGDVVRKQVLTSLGYAVRGIFGDPLSSTHVYDGTGGTISYEAIGEGAKLIGDKLTSFTTIYMHSKVYQDARNANLISYPSLPITNQTITTGRLEFIYGMRVVVDDLLCSVVSTGVYPTYLCGPGAFRVAYQKAIEIEPYRTPLTGGGTDNIIFRTYYAVGMPGVSYTSATSNPADTVLDDNSVWTKVGQTKNIKAVMVKTL